MPASMPASIMPMSRTFMPVMSDSRDLAFDPFSEKGGITSPPLSTSSSLSASPPSSPRILARSASPPASPPASSGLEMMVSRRRLSAGIRDDGGDSLDLFSAPSISSAESLESSVMPESFAKGDDHGVHDEEEGEAEPAPEKRKKGKKERRSKKAKTTVVAIPELWESLLKEAKIDIEKIKKEETYRRKVLQVIKTFLKEKSISYFDVEEDEFPELLDLEKSVREELVKLLQARIK